jgi:hypothetical protein
MAKKTDDELAYEIELLADQMDSMSNTLYNSVCQDNPYGNAVKRKVIRKNMLWIIRKLNQIKKVQDSIKSDERWPRFEIGRVYATRWDCKPMPEGVRQAA